MVTRSHLDTDFLVKALLAQGPERVLQVSDSAAELETSALAWYELCRGPRVPQQEAVARSFLETDGVIAFAEPIATRAADVFRQLGSPRKRGADVAIPVTALARGARLLTGNLRDDSGIEGLLLGRG